MEPQTDTLHRALDDVLLALPTQRGYRSVSASWSVDDDIVTLTLTVVDAATAEES